MSASTTCRKNERKLTWSPAGDATGPQGDQGPKGDKGDPGPKGDQGDPGTSGSADTPAQVLAKLLTVDGSGSGLDASLLDGHNSSDFLSTTGKAVDATNLPAGLVMLTGSVQNGNQVHLRFSNVTGAASVADNDVPIRWYAFNP